MAENNVKDSGRRGWLRLLIVILPSLVILCMVGLVAVPRLWGQLSIGLPSFGGTRQVVVEKPVLAPFFTAEIDYWQEDIIRWAAAANLDPNLAATIMQIESCGDPLAISGAGAMGLMQVMPMHFEDSEDGMDPEVNAPRGLQILSECLYSPYNETQDIGLAFACYNGGPSVFVYAWEGWPQQSRDYYIWGTNIYNDALVNAESSVMLDEWLLAGGQSLCLSAQRNLALTPEAQSG